MPCHRGCSPVWPLLVGAHCATAWAGVMQRNAGRKTSCRTQSRATGWSCRSPAPSWSSSALPASVSIWEHHFSTRWSWASPGYDWLGLKPYQPRSRTWEDDKAHTSHATIPYTDDLINVKQVIGKGIVERWATFWDTHRCRARRTWWLLTAPCFWSGNQLAGSRSHQWLVEEKGCLQGDTGPARGQNKHRKLLLLLWTIILKSICFITIEQ